MRQEFSLTLDGIAYKIVAEGTSILVNGQPFTVGPGEEGNQVLVDGTSYDVMLDGSLERAVVGGIPYDLLVEGLKSGKGETKTATIVAASEGSVTAIMPGKIIRVPVSEGQQVDEGDVICILEAMKMENELKAPKAGTVKALHVQPGQDVEMGAVLAEIE